jgi:hypothetical protein
VAGDPLFLPATPAGIQQILLRSGIDPSRKHVVICGRSNIVGKPLMAMMVQKAKGANAVVTVCHTGAKDLSQYTRLERRGSRYWGCAPSTRRRPPPSWSAPPRASTSASAAARRER